LRAGFDAYLSKPIDNRRLRDMVRGYLHLPGPS
jgi:CheY-like chemotaxis protein